MINAGSAQVTTFASCYWTILAGYPNMVIDKLFSADRINEASSLLNELSKTQIIVPAFKSADTTH
jgi:hypothetical protein